MADTLTAAPVARPAAAAASQRRAPAPKTLKLWLQIRGDFYLAGFSRPGDVPCVQLTKFAPLQPGQAEPDLESQYWCRLASPWHGQCPDFARHQGVWDAQNLRPYCCKHLAALMKVRDELERLSLTPEPEATT